MLHKTTLILAGIAVIMVVLVGSTFSQQPTSQPSTEPVATDIELIALDFPDQTTLNHAIFKIQENSIPSNDLVVMIERTGRPIVKMSFEIIDDTGQVVYSTEQDKPLIVHRDATIRTIHLNRPIATNLAAHPPRRGVPILTGRNFSCVQK